MRFGPSPVQEGPQTSVSTGLWVILYFLANLALTIHNKWILSRLNFNFPWTLTAIHIGISGIGSWLMCSYNSTIKHQKLGQAAWIKLLSFSVLYAINIAMSNVSLAYVSLSFHQIVRSSVPAFTLLVESTWLHKSHSMGRKLSIFPLILGVTMATTEEFKDVSFTILGLVLTVVGVALAALKGIATNILMVGPLKMHPLQVISHMALPSVFQCLIYGAIAGEHRSIINFLSKMHLSALEQESTTGISTYPVISLLTKLLMNGFLAFLLNWVSFTANKKTSALTMTVVGNVKQIVSISLAIYIFHTPVTGIKMFGIILTIVGAAWYSFSKTEQLTGRGQLPTSLLTAMQKQNPKTSSNENHQPLLEQVVS